MIKKISVMAVLQFVLTLLSAITIPYYLRVIGVSNYGLMGVAIAVNQYFLLVVDYGFTLTAARLISQNSPSKEKISKLFSSILFIKLLIFFVGFLFLVSVLKFIDINVDLIPTIKIGTIIVLGNLLTPTWLYLGKERMKSLIIMTIIPRLIALPLIFTFINDTRDLNLAMWLYAMPILVTGIVSCAYVFYRKWAGLAFYRYSEIKFLLIDCWPLFFSSFSTNFYTSLTPIVINAFAGAYATGIFSALDKIRVALLSGISPISQIVFPKINNIFSKKISEGFHLVRKIAFWMLFGIIIVAISTIGLSNILTHLIFGKYIELASISLSLFSLSLIFNVLNLILGMYVFIPLGLAKIYANVIFISGLFHVLFLALLSYFFGFLGASLCLLSTEILIASILLIKLSNINDDFNKAKFKKSILFRIYYGI
jgi:PST family polysaccharide transporter